MVPIVRWSPLLITGVLSCAMSSKSLVDDRSSTPTSLDEQQRQPSHEPRVHAIPRTELTRFLADSPGSFLAHVDTTPMFREHRFNGWRLNAFFPGDPRFDGIDIHPGDIVTRINGLPIERPEEFMKVWQEAGVRPLLSVELVRNGSVRTITWAIVD